MSQYESFYRDKALGAESRQLPAEQYNLMRLLLDFSGKPCVFVPIRSMQYMAVIDPEEIIFVDAQHKTDIEFAWRYFRPQVRVSLQDPVPYTFEYYNPRALINIPRAQGEFFQAVKLLAERMRKQEKSVNAGQRVVPFPPRQA